MMDSEKPEVHEEFVAKSRTAKPAEAVKLCVPAVLVEDPQMNLSNDQDGESIIPGAKRDYVEIRNKFEDATKGANQANEGTVTEPANGEETKGSKNEHKSVYKFQVAWDPVSKPENVGSNIRHHVVIAPTGKGASSVHDIQVVDFPESSPLYTAVKSCRDKKGIPIITGFWKHWDKPTAVLFDIDSMPVELINRYCAELKRDRGIHIPNDDDYCRKSIALGYCAAEFLIQFELAIGTENVSQKSWMRFHDWLAAAGAVFVKQWFKPCTQVAIVFSETRLGNLVPGHPSEALKMAHELNATHRYALELAAAGMASQVLVNVGVDLDMIEKQVFRRPTRSIKFPWLAPVKRFFTRQRYAEMTKTRKTMIVLIKKRNEANTR